MTARVGEEAPAGGAAERPAVLVAEAGTDGVDAAAAAARRVIDALLRSGDSSTADMSDAAARLDALAEELQHHAPAFADRMVDMWRGDGITRHDPVTGPENPIAPPLVLTGQDDGSVAGVVEAGVVYQGPPGYVHGGVSALLLDHTLGVANHWAGALGMTAGLTLRYRRPVPLFEPLTVTGRLISNDGRKIGTEGEISAGGRVCVTAEALFIATHPERPR